MTNNDQLEKIQMDICFEERLHDLTLDLNAKFNGEEFTDEGACSVFLFDKKRDAYILRASTQGTSYLGKAKIAINRKNNGKYPRNSTGIGLTVSAITMKKAVFSEGKNITDDQRFSNYGKNDTELEQLAEKNYCEFLATKTKSLIAAPIIFRKSKKLGRESQIGNVIGVIRIVRSLEHEKHFTQDDANRLESEIEQEADWIQTSVFLSALIELGTHGDQIKLCSRAAEDFRNLLNTKGCSVFLLDENDSTDKNKIYKCFGTTGLAYTEGEQSGKMIENPKKDERAFYTLGSTTPKSFTIASIKYRRNIFVDNIHDKIKCKEALPKEYNIDRKEGSGQVSEHYMDDSDNYLKSECVFFCPMYYNDPENEDVDVLGVVRVQTLVDNINPKQKHLLISLVESLSKAITSARLVEFIDHFEKFNSTDQLFAFVVKNIPKFIGGRDCAILIKENEQLKMLAEWKKGSLTDKDELSKKGYDLSSNNATRYGYTGWVAKYKKVLRFNDRREIKSRDFEEDLEPTHSNSSEFDPDRFLGVPVLISEQTAAVLRLCKSKEESRITEEDEHVLSVIARRLKPYIEELKQAEIQRTYLSQVFSNELVCKINILNHLNCKDNLKRFFKDIQLKNPIEKSIIDFINDIKGNYESLQYYNTSVFDDFLIFNNKILNKIPHYRDHFIHQFVVYLIGAIIIDNIKDDFSKSYYEAYKINKSDIDKQHNIEFAWLITALFHDVAYPLQTMNEWVGETVKRFSGKQIPFNTISIDSLLLDHEFIVNIDILSKFHEQIFQPGPLFTTCRENIIGILQDGLKEKGLDHGIMEAMSLMRDNRLNRELITPCASAISLHNRLLDKCDNRSISLKNHPLAFMLVFCDLLHEWGRNRNEEWGDSRNFPVLEKLEVLDSDTDLVKLGIEEIPSSKKKYVFAHIGMDLNHERKIEEANKVFNKLTSDEIAFCMKINERSFVTK